MMCTGKPVKPTPAHDCPGLYLKLLGSTYRFKVFQDLSIFYDDLNLIIRLSLNYLISQIRGQRAKEVN